MKYLVTGGAGFIGSHLVEKLLGDGHQVLVLDDFSEGKWSNLPAHANLEILKVSILDDINRFFVGTDVVFHLAALPRPQLSIVDPVPANLVNVNGLLNVLLAARDNNVKRLVFASSASIYGEQSVYPSPEDAEPNPMSPYALHKVIGEGYCKLFTNIYGLETNCLRFFNVYGNRMNPNGFYSSLIPKFIKMIKEGTQPTIFGSGEQARDFVYVEDVAEALIKAANSQIYGEVFNVGWGENYSVNKVHKIICDLLGKYIEPIHGEAMIEPTQTLADTLKSYQLLRWEPKITLEDGIKKMI